MRVVVIDRMNRQIDRQTKRKTDRQTDTHFPPQYSLVVITRLDLLYTNRDIMDFV